MPAEGRVSSGVQSTYVSFQGIGFVGVCTGLVRLTVRVQSDTRTPVAPGAAA
jgi:hypothetical protein